MLMLALLTSGAFALEVTIDPSAEAFAADVEAAIGDWRAAGIDPDLVEAALLVRVGPEGRFGPDVQAWLLVRPESGDGPRRYELLIAPNATAARAAAIPALGVVLGGSLGTGAFDPVLDPAGARRPGIADGQRREALRAAIPGDLNASGQVDFEDLLLLAAEFGRRGVNLPADLDGDGQVGVGDLEILRGAYTFTPPAP